MTFKEAKNQFLQELKEESNCLTTTELVEILGITTIRCCWVDYVDYLAKDHQISERQRYNWGQVL